MSIFIMPHILTLLTFRDEWEMRELMECAGFSSFTLSAFFVAIFVFHPDAALDNLGAHPILKIAGLILFLSISRSVLRTAVKIRREFRLDDHI